jgi:hypothetical protein
VPFASVKQSPGQRKIGLAENFTSAGKRACEKIHKLLYCPRCTTPKGMGNVAQGDSKRPGDTPSGGVPAGELAGVGLQFAATILVFLLGGMWLDRRLGTDPWFLIGGVVLGGAGGFWSMYTRLVVAPRERKRP